MTEEETNEKAKIIFNEYSERKDAIRKEAIENGFVPHGLDGEGFLFKDLNKETKQKLEELKKQIDKPMQNEDEKLQEKNNETTFQRKQNQNIAFGR